MAATGQVGVSLGPIGHGTAELARMGYKQELKCVRFNLCAHYLRNLGVLTTARRDLTLLNVSHLRNDYACTVLEGVRRTEFWCLVLNH